MKLPVNAAGEVEKRVLSAELKPWKLAYKLLQTYQAELINEDTYKSKNCVILGDDTKETKELITKGGQPLLTPVSHFGAGKNIWILKPTGMNRGRGIYVVDNVKELKRIIKQSCVENSKLKLAEDKLKQQPLPPKQKGQMYMPEPAKAVSTSAPVVETKTFVI